MLWFFPALGTAFFSASMAALVKKKFGDISPFELTAFPLAYSLPFFGVYLLLAEVPVFQPQFWLNLAVMVPLTAVGFLLNMRAVAVSPLSKTMPFMALTPAVVIFTGFFYLGELPTAGGTIGILTIVAGGYILNLDGIKSDGLLGPFKAIGREPGTRLMLIAAVIWGFCAVIGKKLVLLSSVFYGGLLAFFIHNACLVAFLIIIGKVRPSIFIKRPGAGLLAGTLLFADIACHFLSVSMITTAYMIAVKRLNGLFAVLYGGWLFKEDHMLLRIIGSALMAAGAALIVLRG